MSEIQRDEFTNWMQTLRADIQGVHERLDALNGRTRAVENKVSVLEDRGIRTTDPTARRAAWFVGLSGLLVEVVKRLTGSPQ